jgi:hypothetical protein
MLADRLVVILPGIVMLLYGVTSWAFWTKGEPAWALTWGAYALANVGLIWASMGK